MHSRLLFKFSLSVRKFSYKTGQHALAWPWRMVMALAIAIALALAMAITLAMEFAKAMAGCDLSLGWLENHSLCTRP